MGFFNFFKLFKKQPKPIKLGLALGSGGAKGFAELGALRAFEENGITFDVIAGTSIGSIIGAFYASGYTSTDILEMLKTIEIGDVKNGFMINMDTSGLFNVIDKSIGSLNIEELKKPFRAVATELETGDEYVFSLGSVATALVASSSYPPFFKPVVVDNKRYIDGAFTNSVPADLVRQLGADYVIGIDLSNHEPKPSGFLDKLFPTYQGKVEKPWEKGYENSDVMLHPDLSAYKPISFGAGSVMYDIGYQCAIENMPKILKDIENLKKTNK
ncbi:MAG: patatin-like phospholipase family protein [Clostridia bacterium]|nr:patatin-like phospholipase family protein [Clostridia bacterium]